MSFSVNTNNNALAALESLNMTQQSMTKTQNRVSSGLKVSGAADDASTFAIAQGQRGDIAGFQQVSNSLAIGGAVVAVALQGATQISDLLNQLKAKVVQGMSSPAGSQTTIQADADSLIASVTSTSTTAQFNGLNLIGAAGVNDDVTSSLDRNAAGTVSVAKITVTASNLSGDGLGISTAGVSGVTLNAAGLVKVEAAITSVQTALSNLGTAANKLTTQGNFIKSLTDTLTSGVGTLVDADLAAESANLQALQTKQQLGIQALSIANQGPGAVLTLFR
jgi:flagellin